MFESLAPPPCSTHIIRPHSRGHHAEELNWVVLNWKKIFIEATSSLDVPTPLSHSGSTSISPRCSDLPPVHPLTWCDKLCLGSRFIPLVPLDFHDAAVKVDAINAAVQGLYKTHTHTHILLNTRTNHPAHPHCQIKSTSMLVISPFVGRSRMFITVFMGHRSNA